MVSIPKPEAPGTPPPPPAPPTFADSSVAQSANAQRMAAAAASGRGFDGTLLTGPSGAPKASTVKSTLGGG